jgi:hypothetical protein
MKEKEMSEYDGKVTYRRRKPITLTELLYYEATGEIMPSEEEEEDVECKI